LKIKLKVKFNVKLSLNLSLNSSDFLFFFFLAVLKIFVSAHKFFITHSFTMRTLFEKCDVITVKSHDDRELSTVNLRLVNEFSY